MGRVKRQQTGTNHDSNKNKKKQKLENKNKSCFENLANETIYEIFDYLDLYDAYQAFFDINKRFKNLFLNSNLSIQINILSMKKSNFESYHKNLIQPNKHRINYLCISNPFTVDIIFSPPRSISKFIRLEKLVLDNFKAKYFDKIFTQLALLPKLYSLTIHPIGQINYSTFLFNKIFRLPKLKYCQIEMDTIYDEESLYDYNTELSTIEYLIIKNRFGFRSFNTLLKRLPQLRSLSINYIHGYTYPGLQLSPILLTNFKSISLKLDSINFDLFEKIIKSSFQNIEVLRLTKKFDSTYLDAKRWEELIRNYIPNLRIFDINFDGIIRNEFSTYYDAINQFNSPFWIEKQWFFTHQHDCQEGLETGIFHSTNPYKRKDYKFYWESDEQKCAHIQETNLQIVKRVSIASKKVTNNSVNYFPNATQLTIKKDFIASDCSISKALNCILPLTQLTTLIINSLYFFPFEQMLELIYHTPNLYRVKFAFLYFDRSNTTSIQTTDMFQSVSMINKITNLDYGQSCTFEEMTLFINLFPRLKYLKTGMYRKQLIAITKYILSKDNPKTNHLFFLCISYTSKLYLQKLNMLIKNEKLLDNYFIKFINKDLFLWW